MSSDNAGRVIFIGNIPYGLSEEQIKHIFSSAGQVLSFRLVHDSDSGRSKGFGFMEFADTDSAASAVRNLDKYQIMNRELRVDYSHVGGKDDSAPPNYNPAPSNPQQQNGYQSSTNIPYPPVPPPSAIQQPSFPATSTLPPLPPGTDLPPGLSCPDAISKTLQTLPPPQLLDMLTKMKELVTSDPAKATELFAQAPQFAYAIFQALLLMGLIDTSVLSSVVEEASQPPATIQPSQPPQASMQQQQRPPPPPQQMGGSGYVSTPPVYGSGPYAPPPPMQQPQPTPQPGQGGAPPAPDNAQALLQQVLAMPQAQVEALPPAERAQIEALRRQFPNGIAGFA
ncbi:hypothetical protein MMC25_004521 [Agyrium rufum]|nr:hypothetical protein [Agyrium rufum]